MKKHPRASSVSIMMCDDPHCSSVHIVLWDARPEIIAEACVPISSVDAFINDLQEGVRRKQEFIVNGLARKN